MISLKWSNLLSLNNSKYLNLNESSGSFVSCVVSTCITRLLSNDYSPGRPLFKNLKIRPNDMHCLRMFNYKLFVYILWYSDHIILDTTQTVIIVWPCSSLKLSEVGVTPLSMRWRYLRETIVGYWRVPGRKLRGRMSVNQ